MKPVAAFTSFRSQVHITPGAVVCSECELSGEIIIGANTIIHPRARIIAEAGPIHIGSFNLIEEQVEIVNKIPGFTMKIGDHNVFEVSYTYVILILIGHCFTESWLYKHAANSVLPTDQHSFLTDLSVIFN
uniref:Dynactin subunit 6 n=1 Tax=Schistosoma japonicum TaxID=6182 RepID=Q5DDL9_SCHJA|nr:SJCHGC03086 protein [Schistosoma japonicum]